MYIFIPEYLQRNFLSHILSYIKMRVFNCLEFVSGIQTVTEDGLRNNEKIELGEKV